MGHIHICDQKTSLTKAVVFHEGGLSKKVLLYTFSSCSAIPGYLCMVQYSKYVCRLYRHDDAASDLPAYMAFDLSCNIDATPPLSPGRRGSLAGAFLVHILGTCNPPSPTSKAHVYIIPILFNSL